MLVLKQCTCGSREFEQEPDDCVLRCAECGSLAMFEFIKDSEDEENV